MFGTGGTQGAGSSPSLRRAWWSPARLINAVMLCRSRGPRLVFRWSQARGLAWVGPHSLVGAQRLAWGQAPTVGSGGG